MKKILHIATIHCAPINPGLTEEDYMNLRIVLGDREQIIDISMSMAKFMQMLTGLQITDQPIIIRFPG